ANVRSLPQGSPAAGLSTVSPSVKARSGGSADLMNFYATSYAVAHGRGSRRPPLRRGGLIPRAEPPLLAVTQASHVSDTTTSTTAEHFKPFWLPDGRSLLPRHVHQPGSGYLQEFSPSCFRTGAMSPQLTRHLQSPPKASRERGTESHRTGPAQPDVLQKTTIGTKEQTGFTRATPRSDSILPALPDQPV
ncbi:PPR32 phosphatase, partial [Ibidorhyncha struthersii]|nr:PPR32 phosphatase [Ibidorhyncha struthersii]